MVLTSKDLTPDERSTLSGKVERILQKGAYSREALLVEVRKIVSECAGEPGGCPEVAVVDKAAAATENQPNSPAVGSGTERVAVPATTPDVAVMSK